MLVRVGDDVSVSAVGVESALSVDALVSLVLAAVSAARVEPVLSVGVLTSLVLAAVASADPCAFVIVEEPLEPVAEAAKASKVVLMLEPDKVGYGPLLKFPCWPSESV